MRAARFAGRAPNAQEIALTGEGGLAGFRNSGPQAHENLDLDAARVAGPHGGDGITPNKHTGVADVELMDIEDLAFPGFSRDLLFTNLGWGVEPLEFEDEVLVLFVRAQIAGRLAGGDDHVLFNIKGARSAVDVVPAGEVLAVEERLEPVVTGAACAETDDEERDECAKALHGWGPPQGVMRHQY